MPMDVRQSLLQLLPGAIAWAEALAREVIDNGISLTRAEEDIARVVGVAKPDLIRIAEVERLPLPEDPALRDAALQTGLLGPNTAGLTLGYAVFICTGHRTRRLLSHEFRHVHQYEQHGSIAAFLPVYLGQIAEYGYRNAPIEQDAREYELRDGKG